MRCEPIELVCGVDNNYAPHLAVLLASIANTNKGENIRAHILHDAVNEELRERVAASAPSLNVLVHYCRSSRSQGSNQTTIEC